MIGKDLFCRFELNGHIQVPNNEIDFKTRGGTPKCEGCVVRTIGKIRPNFPLIFLYFWSFSCYDFLERCGASWRRS